VDNLAASAETLPAITDATLPATYEAARNAIAECERVDECKEWKDKAAAMKAYAIMRDDRTLHNLALRIQLRAERRCGELLKQIEPANGARTDLGRATTRGSIAEDAGLSEHQRKTALRVASVPDAEFNSAVESDSPPTVTQLANQGKLTRVRTETIDAVQAAECQTPDICEILAQFVQFCEAHEPIALARACSMDDAAALRRCVDKADLWLYRFEMNLPKSERYDESQFRNSEVPVARR